MIKQCIKNVAHLWSNSEVSPLFLPYFKQSCVIADWIQAVSHITHLSHSSGKTLIDLQVCITYWNVWKGRLCRHAEQCWTVLNSDHSMIYGVYCKGGKKWLAKDRSISYRSFKKCSVCWRIGFGLRENLLWSVMDIFDSLDDKWEYLSIFWAVVDKHAPMRKVRVRECSSLWITRARNYYCT